MTNFVKASLPINTCGILDLKCLHTKAYGIEALVFSEAQLGGSGCFKKWEIVAGG
jgi:hypothetical protein